jgi:anti-sigma B factor antagonist
MSGGNLAWQVEERDGARVVAPGGRVDESTATAYTERLIAEAGTARSRLVLDLSGIAYMSSRGLRALTLAQREAARGGSAIVLARPNETMREILAISRYDMIFKVADTIEDALTL